ncbi:hypothetical protein KP003_04455 [Geomonas nitrogeniifigens]|uniref:Lipoprotein n=1 Tax=Geomonas diazotrophica TaxID=2843197 RepID=A0ABX8JMU0_9BACT|nr:hypothetical protein [Geomonas nitrogeniifigens]QWV98476.1 hypothetical protein KP005_04095 [Geomonas nitrogeniifigens]QXE87659.1 hypothetical protein KP003_04455 [Geomonas nitrogeniifigens]
MKKTTALIVAMVTVMALGLTGCGGGGGTQQNPGGGTSGTIQGSAK